MHRVAYEIRSFHISKMSQFIIRIDASFPCVDVRYIIGCRCFHLSARRAKRDTRVSSIVKHSEYFKIIKDENLFAIFYSGKTNFLNEETKNIVQRSLLMYVSCHSISC